MVLIELELNSEAFEEVRDKCITAGLIADELRSWDEDSKPFTVGGVTFKEWKYVPTPEDIARREEYLKSPFGQSMQQMLNLSAAKIADLIQNPSAFARNPMFDGIDTTDMKVGTTLRIRLPRDYFVKIGDEWLDR